jgi:ubiquinol-cytochrome c reductase iron-sulfur subunit
MRKEENMTTLTALPINEPMDPKRRQLMIATSVAGAAAGAGIAIPLLSSMAPSERARAAGAPVEVDISKLAPGEMMTVEWRGKPVWIVHRTPEQLAELPKVDAELADPESKRNNFSTTPAFARNDWRSIKPEYLVVVGICTHLGCSPSDKFTPGPQPSLPNDWSGGFLCPCHGSTFDMSGRVFKGKPAPDNLEVPPYMYLSDSRILVGAEKKA